MSLKKALTVGFSFLIATGASAIEVEKCPRSVKVSASVDKVYKDSIYRDVPGWREAQAALNGTQSLEMRYTLTSRKRSMCSYRDNDGNYAALSTAEFLDPEEGTVHTDQFILGFSIDDARFVSYVPIKEYSADGLKAYSRPFPLKVKARLRTENRKKWGDYDLGMLSITID